MGSVIAHSFINNKNIKLIIALGSPFYLKKHSKLITICGGNSDYYVECDSNPSTFYTSDIQFVWTNCDHKQLVWCNQLMIVLSNLINTFQSADIVRKKLIGYPGTSIHSDSKK